MKGSAMSDDLVTRLRMKARESSETARILAEAKSLRQEDNLEGRIDLYMWPTPEQTIEWKAADRIEALQSALAQAEAAIGSAYYVLTYVEQLSDDADTKAACAEARAEIDALKEQPHAD
jgi:hypothetical protein